MCSTIIPVHFSAGPSGISGLWEKQTPRQRLAIQYGSINDRGICLRVLGALEGATNPVCRGRGIRKGLLDMTLQLRLKGYVGKKTNE